jgi:hypothetical protein
MAPAAPTAPPRLADLGLESLELVGEKGRSASNGPRGHGSLELGRISPNGRVPVRLRAFWVAVNPGFAGFEEAVILRMIGLGAADDHIEAATGRGNVTAWLWIENAEAEAVHRRTAWRGGPRGA